MYSKADHDRIHDAIIAAEQRTSGEIYCVVAEESGQYREVVFAWAAAIALLAPPAALLAGLRPTALANALGNHDWIAGQASSALGLLPTVLVGYALVQVALFVAALALLSVPAVRRFATPSRLKASHVHAKAMEQFAHRLHTTSGRTGVLIFASLAERRVQVVGDEDIHAKVGEALWDQAVAAAVSHIQTGDTAGGLIAAIKLCGEALAEHFPPDGSQTPAGDVAEI